MIFDQAIRFTGDGRLADATTVREALSAHLVRTGGRELASAETLLAEIARVELTGRGGGHFPAAAKLRPLVRDGAHTVVVNGSEGELLSSKDAALLQLRPHLVLDGAQALARLVRAQRVVLWLHRGADASVASMKLACEERERDVRYRNEVPVQIMLGPARYLTGEASSVIAGVRGEPVLPKFIENPAQPWIDGQPVLVHNAETVARVGLLDASSIRFQATSLVTLSLHTHRLVVEVSPATTFGGLFREHGIAAPEFVLLGGFGGEWMPWSSLETATPDPHLMRERGLSFGTGIVSVVPNGRKGLEWSAEILEWMAGESAGQCGPCIFGLPALAKQYTRASAAHHISDRRRDQLEQAMQLVEKRGACRHPDGAVRMARSALKAFGESR